MFIQVSTRHNFQFIDIPCLMSCRVLWLHTCEHGASDICQRPLKKSLVCTYVTGSAKKPSMLASNF